MLRQLNAMLSNRLPLWKQIAWRPALVLAAVPWALMGAYNLLKSEFMPASVQAKYQLRNLSPWPWWVWALLSLAIVVIVILESAYRVIRKRDSLHSKEVSDLKAQLEDVNLAHTQIVKAEAENHNKWFFIEEERKRLADELSTANEQLQKIQQQKPALDIKIKEVIAVSQSYRVDFFVWVDVRNLTPDAPTTVYDMTLFVTVAEKSLVSHKPLSIAGYSTATWEMDEDTGREYTVEEERLDVDEDLTRTMKTIPVEWGKNRRGWLHFAFHNVPPSAFRQYGIGEYETWQDDDGEWQSEEITELKLDRSLVQSLEIKVLDVFDSPHPAKKEGKAIFNSFRTVISSQAKVASGKV